mmetsp:Transcript_9916/g.18716  ORF Transcript_9916/g.18716 Transcript_9916/m.18716 type:complete len:100 (-) Transcript_9916:1345-1644(-)
MLVDYQSSDDESSSDDADRAAPTHSKKRLPTFAAPIDPTNQPKKQKRPVKAKEAPPDENEKKTRHAFVPPQVALKRKNVNTEDRAKWNTADTVKMLEKK